MDRDTVRDQDEIASLRHQVNEQLEANEELRTERRALRALLKRAVARRIDDAWLRSAKILLGEGSAR